MRTLFSIVEDIKSAKEDIKRGDYIKYKDYFSEEPEEE